MLEATDSYFRSGRRVCLIGAFALDESRDLFAKAINSYFGRWVAHLAEALTRTGHSPAKANELAEETVGAIQGALTLARAFDDTAVFSRALQRARAAAGSLAARPFHRFTETVNRSTPFVFKQFRTETRAHSS